MTRRLLPVLTLLLFAIAVSGCLEVKELYTINPDGTGKVTLESTVKTLMFSDPKANKKKQVNDFVASVINHSVGVDVWKDISCDMLSDGRIHFVGTAYFHDLSALNVKEVTMAQYTLAKENGSLVLGMASKKNDSDDTERVKVNLTEAEIATKIDSMKEQFKTARGMMGMFLDELNEVSSFKIAGTVGTATGFTRNPDGTLGMTTSGKRVMQILDSIMASDEFWRQAVLEEASGIKASEKDEEMMRLMFGASKPVAIVTPAANPLFDYNSEAASARKKYPALLKKYSVKKEEETPGGDVGQ